MTDTACSRSGLESSKVEIEVYARRFPFSYKIIKKTESKESLADLLEHAETRMSRPFCTPLSPNRPRTRKRQRSNSSCSKKVRPQVGSCSRLARVTVGSLRTTRLRTRRPQRHQHQPQEVQSKQPEYTNSHPITAYVCAVLCCGNRNAYLTAPHVCCSWDNVRGARRIVKRSPFALALTHRAGHDA